MFSISFLKAAAMVKRSRPSGGNKFNAASNDKSGAMKGESDSEGEEDHALGEEVVAQRRGGKMLRVEGGAGSVAVAALPGAAVDGSAVFKNKQRVLIIASRGIIHRCVLCISGST